MKSFFARSNRGYGLERMIKMIYFENGTKHRIKQIFYRCPRCLMKHNESSGEDLYACIQDPEMTILVTKQRWLRKQVHHVPKGYGQSQGGRASKLSMKIKGSYGRFLCLPTLRLGRIILFGKGESSNILAHRVGTGSATESPLISTINVNY